MLVNHKRVARMMREDNLLAVQPRAFVVTTDSDHELEVYLNLASRMKLTGINQLWVADITYIRLKREFVYLAVILDAFSRKVVGWALDRTLAARLPLAGAGEGDRGTAAAAGLVHHSDRGVQYASGDYVGRAAQAQHDSEHEPAGESLRQRQLRELHEDAQAGRDLRERVPRSRSSAREHRGVHRQLLQSRTRLHSALGYRPPEEFEQAANSGATSQGATMSFFRHEEIYRSDGGFRLKGSRPKPAPRLIVSMSLRLAIPWRVALQQSPPPLRQPRTIVEEKRGFE